MPRASLALLAAALLASRARAASDTPHPDAPALPPQDSSAPISAPSLPSPARPPPDGGAPISTSPAPPPTPADEKKVAPDKDGAAQKARTAKAPLPRGAILEDVAGIVRNVDRKAHRVDVETPSGIVGLTVDRNTLVYGPGGLVTTLDVKPGSQIRAGRNADFVAYWIAVRAPASPGAVSTPDQGTGPAGTTAGPSSTVGPGSATPPGPASTPPVGP